MSDFISIEEANTLVENYKSEIGAYSELQPKSFYVSRNSLNALLAIDPNAEGFRVYPGIDSNSRMTLIFVNTLTENTDAHNLILDRAVEVTYDGSHITNPLG